jgi:hypothetical protein
MTGLKDAAGDYVMMVGSDLLEQLLETFVLDIEGKKQK